MALKEGDAAPNFSLGDQSGKIISLDDYRGSIVVVYFYPKDDTPGCTIEACEFRDTISEIKSKGAVVLGISLDDTQSHNGFAQKYNLNFPILSDTNAEVSRKYGVYVKKNLYGKDSMGIARTTFVIGKDGRIKKIFEKVQPQGHSKEVLTEIQE